MEEKKTNSFKGMIKDTFTAKKIALMATFVALAFGISFLQFPIFPAAPFLQLDFSFAIMLIAAYLLGALSGEIIVVLFTLLKLPFSGSAMVGELANFIMAQFFIVIPAVIYHFRRRFGTVVISLSSATLVISAIALLTNRYMLFPLYMGEGAAATFGKVWWMIILFNIIKGVSNSVITILLYKRLRNLLNKFL